MLKDGTVLMVICIIVVGALAAWWIKAPVHHASSTGMQVEQTAAVAPAPAPVVKRLPKLKAAAVQVEEEPVALAIDSPVNSSASITTPAVRVQTPARPFPGAEQIASGAHEDSITDKYGDPALSAVTSTGGHMVETFVYATNRGRNSTVIRLRDGKVATAYSHVEPSVPPGLSAPRRFRGQ